MKQVAGGARIMPLLQCTHTATFLGIAIFIFQIKKAEALIMIPQIIWAVWGGWATVVGESPHAQRLSKYSSMRYITVPRFPPISGAPVMLLYLARL